MRDYDIRAGVRRLFHLDLHRPQSAVQEMDEELQHFIEERVAYLTARGHSEAAARTEALRRFGPSFQQGRAMLRHSARKRARHMRLHIYLSDLLHDVRYAARGLTRRPGFAVVAILTLALGIGADTAIYSAVNALLLRPLPFRAPERLTLVSLVPPRDQGQVGDGVMPWSFPKFRVFRDAQRSYSELALQGETHLNLSGDGAERVAGEEVSAHYLRTLGVQPALGRDFPTELDGGPDATRLVIISHALWSRRFNRDPNVLGQ